MIRNLFGWNKVITSSIHRTMIYSIYELQKVVWTIDVKAASSRISNDWWNHTVIYKPLGYHCWTTIMAYVNTYLFCFFLGGGRGNIRSFFLCFQSRFHIELEIYYKCNLHTSMIWVLSKGTMNVLCIQQRQYSIICFHDCTST